jgi:hypothetical protein
MAMMPNTKSGYRIELAVPKKGTRTNWPTWKLTDDHCVAAFKAIIVALSPSARKGPGMTRREKRLARNVAELLVIAFRHRQARDWLDSERPRIEKLRRERNAKRRREYGRRKRGRNA